MTKLSQLLRNQIQKKTLFPKLKAEFDLTERQANYIAGMQIYQLGNQNFVALKKSMANLLKLHLTFQIN